MITFIKRAVKYIRFYGGRHECNVCRRSVRKFFPFSKSLQESALDAGFPYDFKRIETLNYDSCNCPFCLSSDRERFYLLFLDLFFKNKEDKKYSILDFAPSKSFSEAIRKWTFVQYTTADYYRTDVDLKLDICDMSSVNDNQYDIIICSHILEHVSSPESALLELYRIIMPGGFAIIMVPLFWDVTETVENPSYNTSELKRKHYGQEDHVRLFAKEDFISRINQAGFTIQLLGVDSFNKEELNKYEISDNSILYVCHKP